MLPAISMARSRILHMGAEVHPRADHQTNQGVPAAVCSSMKAMAASEVSSSTTSMPLDGQRAGVLDLSG
jgi:hypothetical protein